MARVAPITEADWGGGGGCGGECGGGGRASSQSKRSYRALTPLSGESDDTEDTRKCYTRQRSPIRTTSGLTQATGVVPVGLILSPAVEAHQEVELDRHFQQTMDCLGIAKLELEVLDDVRMFSSAMLTQLRLCVDCVPEGIAIRDAAEALQLGSLDVDPEAVVKSARVVQQKWRDALPQLMNRWEFGFVYKQRPHRGYAVHIAALHRKGDALLRELLALKVDLQKECRFSAYGIAGKAQAIHLASGRGNYPVVDALLSASPELINEKTTLYGDNRFHYTALHEAAFFGQVTTVQYLLQHQADPNARNKDGSTPLHVAAKQGEDKVARKLVDGGADTRAKDLEGRIALAVAVDHGVFPHQKLYLLTMRSIEDLLLVAHKSPKAASALMRDYKVANGTSTMVHQSWRYKLTNQQVSTDTWITLMNLAPEAAEDLLEAVTVEPAVENKYYHPLPRQALLSPMRIMNTKYCEDKTWRYDINSSHPCPPWHLDFCPGPVSCSPQFSGKSSLWPSSCRALCSSSGGSQVTQVKIKVVNLLGLLNMRVMHALVATDHLHIFTKLAVRAIIEYSWRSFVRWFYWVHTLYRLAVISMLVLLVVGQDQSEVFYRASWSFLLVCACRELHYELWEIYGYLFEMGTTLWFFVDNYLMNFKNAFDIGAILLLLMLVGNSRHNNRLDEHPGLLAFVVFSNWIQLTYTFRAFPLVGQKLLPITQCFVPMSGIVFIAVFVFCGFLHAFVALNSVVEGTDRLPIHDVFVDIFRLLFLGDGDGIDTALWLGERSLWPTFYKTCLLLFSVIIFSICILNLFIAGTSEAYERAQELSMTSFLQERASICLQCLFRPSLRWGRIRGRHRSFMCCLLAIVSLPVWLLMLTVTALHPVVPSAFLLLVISLVDAILLHHSWGHAQSNGKYLWICHRVDYDEASLCLSDVDSGTQIDGRLASLKQDSMVKHRRVMQRVENIQRDVRGVSKRLACLDDQISVVSTTLLRALGKLKGPGPFPPQPPETTSLSGTLRTQTSLASGSDPFPAMPA